MGVNQHPRQNLMVLGWLALVCGSALGLAALQLLPTFSTVHQLLMVLHVSTAAAVGLTWVLVQRRRGDPTPRAWGLPLQVTLLTLLFLGKAVTTQGMFAPRVVSVDRSGKDMGPDYPQFPKVLVRRGGGPGVTELCLRRLYLGVIMGRECTPYQG